MCVCVCVCGDILSLSATLERDMEGEEVDAYSSWTSYQSQPVMVDDLLDIRPGQPLSCQVSESVCVC